ncbi:peptide MFS transporter [Acetobacter conturbans]|uniref:peptide MFS transporter n=1 Tax=Acetobacter conturbans TaxID=1737472 RepID=UPI0015689FB4|nr:peptide MFS transporter [Acetobacter conturbans]
MTDIDLHTVVKNSGGRSTFFGHPRGLFLLSFVEMWERFSFYGMRALLVVYMTASVLPDASGHVHGFSILTLFVSTSDPVRSSSLLYGFYSGLVYLTPIFGGLLADRILGKRVTIILGGILIAAGHMLLTVKPWFLLALLLIVVGTGGLKGNIAAQVGDLYALDDSRRERGFSIYYLAINIGAAVSPLVCMVLVQHWGWEIAFDATTVGMFIGLVTYMLGSYALPAANSVGIEKTVEAKSSSKNSFFILFFIAVSAIFLWVSYEQQANALVRWTSVSSNDIGMAWLQAIPPLIVLVGTPILTHLWSKQARHGNEPDALKKLLIGACIITAAQSFLVVIAGVLPATAPASWIMALYLMVWEIGDLFFCPAALGLFSRLAPRGFEGLTMALWYVTFFFGNLASGWIGTLWGTFSPVTYWLMIASCTALGVLGITMLRKSSFLMRNSLLLS